MLARIGKQTLSLLLSAQVCISGIVFTISLPLSFPTSIENNIIGTPKLGCLEDSIEFSFTTEKQFVGRLYTKGRANDPACRMDFFNSTNLTTNASYFVKMGHCGMMRMRSVDPPGMYMIIILVVSFHPIFETKWDRAFRLQCLFRPMLPQTVTQSLEVSNLPTTPVGASSTSTGSCSYTVRRGTVDGPPMRFAVVGDKAVHVWECEGSDSSISLLVHGCYASDSGAKINVPIVDEKGCTMDPILLEPIQYDTNSSSMYERPTIRAYAISHVYKYSDQATISFTCNLRICVKASGDCDRESPPSCTYSRPEIIRRRIRARPPRHANESILARSVEQEAWPDIPVFNQQTRQIMDYRNVDVSTGDIFILPKDALGEKNGPRLSHTSTKPLIPASEITVTAPPVMYRNTTEPYVIEPIGQNQYGQNRERHPHQTPPPVIAQPTTSSKFTPPNYDFDILQDHGRPVGTVCIPSLSYAVMAASTLLALVATALFVLMRLAKALGLLWLLGHRENTKRRSFNGHPYGQQLRSPALYTAYASNSPPPIYAGGNGQLTLTGPTYFAHQRELNFANANFGHRSAYNKTFGDPGFGYAERIPAYASDMYYS